MVTLMNFVVRHLKGRKAHAHLCFADVSSDFTACSFMFSLTDFKNYPALILEPYVAK